MINKTRTRQLKRQQNIKLISFLGFIAIFLFVLLKAENMLLTFVVAFVISYLLAPLINYCERRGMSRTLAIAITFIGTSILVSIGISATMPFFAAQISSLKSELPKYIEGTVQLFADVETRIDNLTEGVADVNISETVQGYLSQLSSSLFEGLPTLLSKSLSTIVMAPFFAFFLLKDGQLFSKRLLALVPNNVFELTLNLFSQINLQMAQFVRARLLEAGIVGFVVWAGLAIVNFPYATLLASFAALMNLIPYVGPLIGAVPAFIIAFINGMSGVDVFIVFFIYALAQLIDIFLIIPLLVAKIVDLHPLTVVIVLVLGFQIMGILGMLISIPVSSALKLTISTVYKHLVELNA